MGFRSCAAGLKPGSLFSNVGGDAALALDYSSASVAEDSKL
jgi:hypothetical protein